MNEIQKVPSNTSRTFSPRSPRGARQRPLETLSSSAPVAVRHIIRSLFDGELCSCSGWAPVLLEISIQRPFERHRTDRCPAAGSQRQIPGKPSAAVRISHRCVLRLRSPSDHPPGTARLSMRPCHVAYGSSTTKTRSLGYRYRVGNSGDNGPAVGNPQGRGYRSGSLRARGGHAKRRSEWSRVTFFHYGSTPLAVTARLAIYDDHRQFAIPDIGAIVRNRRLTSGNGRFAGALRDKERRAGLRYGGLS